MWDGFKNGAIAAWDGVKSVFSTVANFFKTVFTNAWTAVKNVFSTGGRIFDGIKEGIVTAFKAIVNAIIGGINKVIAIPFNTINSVLNGIRNINILGVTPFTWVGTINVPQIPKLAKGGIIAQPTMAVVGERGKEAVMPLENNLEWLDILADKLASRIGNAGGSYIIQLDGRTIQRGIAKRKEELSFAMNGRG